MLLCRSCMEVKRAAERGLAADRFAMGIRIGRGDGGPPPSFVKCHISLLLLG